MLPVMLFLIPRMEISPHHYRASFPTLSMTQLLIIVKCIHKTFEAAPLKFQNINHSPGTESCVEIPLVSTIKPPTNVSHENCKSIAMITLDNRPYQTTPFNFPQREFGQKKYRFQVSWFQK